MTPEGAVLNAVTDLLTVERIPWFRMNTGAFTGEHNGKRRFVKFGQPGMADVLACYRPKCHCRGKRGCGICAMPPEPVWIECKAPGGKQSAVQKEFQAYVESHGMTYLLVSDVSQLIDWLKEKA